MSAFFAASVSHTFYIILVLFSFTFFMFLSMLIGQNVDLNLGSISVFLLWQVSQGLFLKSSKKMSETILYFKHR
jgi:hypothetical protein